MDGHITYRVIKEPDYRAIEVTSVYTGTEGEMEQYERFCKAKIGDGLNVSCIVVADDTLPN